ncbi:hypothetical protein SEA_DARDANUS_2 [Gordonia phage Dardanus]|uniref:Uncharacterized protein n=1 Tax=Gordonia phage Dardanus TaxID=2588489 RepID=A0A514CWZ5_9CAUD|nr:hypothetical protein KDJ58_gp02 [Gordonia phage Dardanus]QDH85039.1 hypothetical protein SEA_DARDANUS_2 [Gordonia phage Dardanus]
MNNTTARRARAARIHDARMSNTFALVTDARERKAIEAREAAEHAERAVVAARFDAMDLDELFAHFD